MLGVLYLATLGTKKLSHKAILAAHGRTACGSILRTHWAKFGRIVTMALVAQKFFEIFLV
jgi:hypothetical protein